ncbi:DUF882 domain-containing protein [Polycladidibacter stylochi]|uniref:DUF882 domain-containing protein n=1 Tax=Polycladidibacter stylochi TaxID=1807766 RepID=UPI0009EB4363|nr:DUF882 domain-containing protein [Pseudovibrio stylochi]
MMFIIMLCFLLAPQVGYASTKTLKLYNTHTKERASITFKRNGRYDKAALRKLNHFLRDWRRNEATKMDPELFDLIYDVYKKSGSKKYIHVVSGYRSLTTNNMLRKRSRGVAKNSQHTKGHAMDFFIPGVSTAKLRAYGLREHVGGVGYYPRSNTPFVHMDTGSVRHWPRMTRAQLKKVFPKGRTIHVPTDGKPLKGYSYALAEIKRNGHTRSRSYADNDSGSFLSRLFSGSKEEAQQKKTQKQPDPGLRAQLKNKSSLNNVSVAALPKAKQAYKPIVIASANTREKPEALVRGAALYSKEPKKAASVVLVARMPKLKPSLHTIDKPLQVSSLSANHKMPIPNGQKREAGNNPSNPASIQLAYAPTQHGNSIADIIAQVETKNAAPRTPAVKTTKTPSSYFESLHYYAMGPQISNSALPQVTSAMILNSKSLPQPRTNYDIIADQAKLHPLLFTSQSNAPLHFIADENKFSGRAIKWINYNQRTSFSS